MKGMAISAMIVNVKSTRKSFVNTRLAKTLACSLSFFNSFEYIGMKEAFRAPSPNNFLNRFGILIAKKKASDRKPAPKNFAIMTSLIKPRMRLMLVKNANTMDDFFSDIG